MLRLKPKLDPLSKARDFWDSLDVTVAASKRELFLGMTTCVLSGLVVGMLISPKKNMTIGSHNGCYNGCPSVPPEEEPEDEE